jgi:hypothetical protein
MAMFESQNKKLLKECLEITTLQKKVDAEKSRSETVEEKVRLDIDSLGENL